jgi:hypothetical protein
MEITFDPAKNQRNIELRGIAFDRVADFEFETALTWLDQRKANERERRTYDQAQAHDQ